ncbi:hypothetical protein JL100_023555 [Skermanella mucosa]|uniref:hypothetical protein n=1 Tax=Skermanella mucosa TaxID=1789672 RepID=UPI00192B751A|nr:hypothetical protein [Skermanella mucosa]UEM20023.1 hypothetical protein JL100_023555 [Skermanella mucosa]
MLTLNDCIAFTDLLPEEVEEISRHERLGFVIALAKGHTLLDRPWGPPAIRQMMRDNLARAMRRGDAGRCGPMVETYRRFQVRHPGGVDRRRSA